ncbi:hypothetical protein [Cytobacillus solani]|uniref:DUF5067 domain-containing protein n=1 Tax=Cytobacillus solani TaxID=1637975 RepID=A0A0Q3T5W6_9BACI|nr:hypothetical protein [Cytobacillus solani]KQL18869.1 hypothetical protein AN957_10010 [Cytobacillus solani]
MEKKSKIILIVVAALSSIYIFGSLLPDIFIKKESDSPVIAVGAENKDIESESVDNSQEEESGATEHVVTWSDNFQGYETKITSVKFDDKTMSVYFELYNGSDVTFLNNVEWGAAVINQKQIKANMFGSNDVGGEHLGDTKHEGYVVYYADSPEDFADVKEVRLTWTLTNDSTYESKDYDIKIPLTP